MSHWRHKFLSPVLIGMGSASFWRGAWYMVDEHFPSNPLYSLGLGIGSVWIFQPMVKTTTTTMNSSLNIVVPSQSQSIQVFNRFMSSYCSSSRTTQVKTLLGIYGLAWSCVLIWHGTWRAWDILYEGLVRLNRGDEDTTIVLHIHNLKRNCLQQVTYTIQSTWEEGSSITMEDVMEGTHDPCTILNHHFPNVDPRNQHTIPESSIPIHHGTISGLASHITAVIALSALGVLSNAFAPPVSAIVRDSSFKWIRRM